MVESFLEGRLSGYDRQSFIEHVKECKTCHEELEIYHVIFSVIEELDSDSDKETSNYMETLERKLGAGGKKADAAEIYLSMSVSSSSVDIGDLVTVTVSAYSDEYFSCDIVVNYDSSILEFYSNSFGSGNTINISGSGSAEITFKAIASGIAYVSTSSEAYNINGEQVYPAEQGVNIEVTDPNTTEETTEKTTEETTEATTEETTTEEESSETTEETTEDEKLSKDCSLMSLRVGSGTLSPEFSADQTSYNLTLPENTTKLDVEAVPSDDRAQYYISGNDDLKNGQNTVTIVVTAENGAYRTYTIYVTVGEAEEELKEMMHNVQDPEGRSFENLYSYMQEDGIDELSDADRFSFFFEPYKPLIDKEIKNFKKEIKK